MNFLVQFFYNSLGSGAQPPKTTINAHIHIFLNDWRDFRQIFDKIIKNLKKSQYFIDNFLKIVKFFAPVSPLAATPLQALPWWTSLPPEKFLRALMNILQTHVNFLSKMLPTLVPSRYTVYGIFLESYSFLDCKRKRKQT